MSPAPARPELIDLRVLIDSGANAREVVVVRVSAEASVDAIRTAIAAQIGQSSMSMFKVSSIKPPPRSLPATPTTPCGVSIPRHGQH